MKSWLALMAVVFGLTACDEHRIFETNHDFESRYWLMAERPEFSFQITDSTRHYNLYCNLRNSITYPYSRLFVHYYLKDSTDSLLSHGLIQTMLFDRSTGKPFGESSIGDIYSQQFALLKDYTFPYTGTFKMEFAQYMRLDTLPGILTIGLRVEESVPKDEMAP